MQERRATGARGRNWLFFGDPRRDCDFLFEDELTGYLPRRAADRLDTAFSRDQDDKIYVQHRMLEHAAELWAWLEDGAHLYVCGDAQRMARDVDAALAAIIAKKAGMSLADAKTYLAALTRASAINATSTDATSARVARRQVKSVTRAADRARVSA